MERTLPIAVVGAGPAGASAALGLRRAGFAEVSLFEPRILAITWPVVEAPESGVGS